MTHLAEPRDLNGSLITVLLPLRAAQVREVSGASGAVSGDFSVDPFLPARASLVADRGLRSWRGQPAPQYRSWATPVLLAQRSELTLGGTTVVFGRSGSTVAEGEPGDQPVRVPESTSASLWLVPGAGFALAMERLVASLETAAITDRLGALMWNPVSTDVPGGRRAGVEMLLDEMLPSGNASLRAVFGAAVDDLDTMLDIEAPVVDLLIPRRTVIVGQEQIEGLVVGLGAAEQSRDLGVDALLFRRIAGDETDFEESDSWQQSRFRWSYQPMKPTQEPARSDALCALRSDARVAVVDLDALSIYHDYLGVGGAEIVRELLPLAALIGQAAGDQEDVTRLLGRVSVLDGETTDPSASRLLQDGLRLVRGVRARLELRRLQQSQLLHEPNFRAWTVSEALRREMAPAALRDQVDGEVGLADDAAATLNRSMESLEVTLLRRQDEERRRLEEERSARERRAQRQERQTRNVIEVAAAVVGAASVIGVFTSMASVPRHDRVMPSLATAGLWTLLSLTVLGLLALVGWWALTKSPGNKRFRLSTAGTLLLLSGVGAATGLLADGGWQLPLVAASCVLLVGAGFFCLLGLGSAPEPEKSPLGSGDRVPEPVSCL